MKTLKIIIIIVVVVNGLVAALDKNYHSLFGWLMSGWLLFKWRLK